MSRLRIAPYKAGSASARTLAAGLRCLRLRNPTMFRPRPNDVVINWGCSTESFPINLVEQGGNRWKLINNPVDVENAQNKLKSLDLFNITSVPTVEYTTIRDEAYGWLQGGATVVARTILRGSGGRGIILLDPDTRYIAPSIVPYAPLYTKYAKKRTEYRVHVVGEEVLHIQQKRPRAGADTDARIRNHDNGWVFCLEDVSAPTCVVDAAERAVSSLHLHFGAVDVGYNEHYNRPYVYEVNTAPNLEGTTLSKYVDALGVLSSG